MLAQEKIEQLTCLMRFLREAVEHESYQMIPVIERVNNVERLGHVQRRDGAAARTTR